MPFPYSGNFLGFLGFDHERNVLIPRAIFFKKIKMVYVLYVTVMLCHCKLS